MKDSRLGTNGAIALIILILSKFIILLSIQGKYLISCILIMPVLSRMTIAWSAGTSAYARKNKKSIAAGLIEHTGVMEIVAATVFSLIISVLFLKLLAVPLTIIMIIFTLLVNLYAKKRIGGITGDIIGAVIEISEAVFLLALLVLSAI